MEKLFDITEKLNAIYHGILTGTSRENLLFVPKGFSNNIFWNIGHVLVTQQALVYSLSKVPPRIDEALIRKYSKGTFPEENVSDAEIQTVAAGLLATPGWTQEDYNNGIFTEFIPYSTSANVSLNTVEDAIAFNIFHMGLHLGTIKAIQKEVP
jgi:hypothetical protein